MSQEKVLDDTTPLINTTEEIINDKKDSFYSSLNTRAHSLHSDHQVPEFLSLDFDRIINSYSIRSTAARNRTKRTFSKSTHSQESELNVGGEDVHSQDKEHQDLKKNEEQPISYLGSTMTRWALTCLVGLFTGLTAILIVYCVEKLVDFRVNRLNRQLQWANGHATEDEIRYWYHSVRFFDLIARDFAMEEIYLSYIAYNLVLVLSCTCLCVLISPGAVGSGIPEVKAHLNGIRVHNFADFKLFFVKLIGTILAVSSGLVVGPEGPIVHLGAIIGASLTNTGDIETDLRQFGKDFPETSINSCCSDPRQLNDINDPVSRSLPKPSNPNGTVHKPRKSDSYWSHSVISSIIFHLSHFRNDLERRNLISIGAAAGFASAFGAPVGGLLYSMEEASSFFSHDMLWKTLTATVIATFCIAVYFGDLTRYSMLSLEIIETGDSNLTRIQVVPLYIVIGCCGGLFGTLFNNMYALMNRRRIAFYDSISNNRNKFLFFKLLESALISILTSVMMLSLAFRVDWACKTIKNTEDKFDAGFLHRFNCPPQQINEIGSILFGSREESIRDILTRPDEFEPETLLYVGILFLGLMIITFGVALPTGMFMPTVLTGASLGGYAGLVFKSKFPGIHAADFALIGAAAFLAGMQRNTVSLCVILMEGTGQTKVLIPVIITVVCARTVGDFFSEGVYEIGMELKGYPFLTHCTKTHYDMFSASDVMYKNVDCINEVENAGSIESLLLVSPHQAFPVVSNETREYKGLIRRDQLVAALECKIYFENSTPHVEHSENGLIDLEDNEEIIMENDIVFKIEVGHIQDQKLSEKKTHSLEWDPAQSEAVSSWHRDNVLKSHSGNNIMFGMDETLPNGKIKNDANTRVAMLNKKVVVYIPQNEKKKSVDIRSLMNRAAFTVLEDCPLSRVYDLFVSMGLRHLPVIGRRGQVTGMISRQCLMDENIEASTGYKFS